MGLGQPAEDFGDDDPTRRAVHAARQSDPGAKRTGPAHGRLCTALGHAAHRQLVGEQGLGNVSDDSEAVRGADWRPRADRDQEPRHRIRLRYALQHPHRRRRSRLSREILPEADRLWWRLRRAPERSGLTDNFFRVRMSDAIAIKTSESPPGRQLILFTAQKI